LCTLKDWAALVSAVSWPVIVGILLFTIDVRHWVERITSGKFWEFEFKRDISTALTSASSDFDRIAWLLDWNKVAPEVRKWAARNDASNPADMGPENFKRFLFDIGLPGGRQTELKWEGVGANRRLIYQ
jgi:hypothetical protein